LLSSCHSTIAASQVSFHALCYVPHQRSHVRIGEAVRQAEDGRDNLVSTIWESASAVSVRALVLVFDVALALDGLEDVDDRAADCIFGLMCASFAWNGNSRKANTLHLPGFSIFALFVEFDELVVAGLAEAVVNARFPDHAEDAAAVNTRPYAVVAKVAPFVEVSRDGFTFHSR
jgi:hypothetical protein